MNKPRVAFLASGNGTLFEYLSRRALEGTLPIVPELLVSSSSSANVLERARTLGIRSEVIDRKSFNYEQDYVRALLNAVAGCDLICLVGFLKLVPAEVVNKFRGRILNIHPALLPAFGGKGLYGMKVHEAVIAYGARVSGATVHIVDEEYDHGPIVAQRVVFVAPNETPETLAKRVHEIEFGLYEQAVRWFAEDRVRVNGRIVTILPAPSYP